MCSSLADVTSCRYKRGVLKLTEAFKSVETVLVDKDYKEIRAIEKLMPDARVLLCQVHAIRAFRKYVRSKRRYADGPVKLFKWILHAEYRAGVSPDISLPVINKGLKSLGFVSEKHIEMPYINAHLSVLRSSCSAHHLVDVHWFSQKHHA